MQDAVVEMQTNIQSSERSLSVESKRGVASEDV